MPGLPPPCRWSNSPIPQIPQSPSHSPHVPCPIPPLSIPPLLHHRIPALPFCPWRLSQNCPGKAHVFQYRNRVLSARYRVRSSSIGEDWITDRYSFDWKILVRGSDRSNRFWVSSFSGPDEDVLLVCRKPFRPSLEHLILPDSDHRLHSLRCDVGLGCVGKID